MMNIVSVRFSTRLDPYVSDKAARWGSPEEFREALNNDEADPSVDHIVELGTQTTHIYTIMKVGE